MKQFLNHPQEIIAVLKTLALEQRTGEVLFQSNEESAKVYLHHGQVVWAFATGQRESFQSILLKENKLAKEKLLEGIKESRRSGKKNLDDILALLGITEPAERRNIVERHTRAAIDVILHLNQCAVQFNPHPVATEETVQGLNLDGLLANVNFHHKPADADSPAAFKRGSETSRHQYKTELAPVAVNDIPEILERLRFEIPNFLAAMIVEGRTSMPIATLSDAPGLDLEVVSAFYRDLIHSAQEALKAMGKEPASPLEEVLISSKDDYVLLRTLCNGSHFLYLLIDQDSNPGMAKVVVRRYLDQLHSFLN
jgi:predicted regulator of Ras-like GTPase activity (Roadblock/LC7/MglB family)